LTLIGRPSTGSEAANSHVDVLGQAVMIADTMEFLKRVVDFCTYARGFGSTRVPIAACCILSPFVAVFDDSFTSPGNVRHPPRAHTR
jgi:hypothetical protein